MPDATRYSLRYLPLFWDDLDKAVVCVARTLHNPVAAQHLVDETERRILEHVENPIFATTYKGKEQRAATYYWFPVGSYMVFCVVEGDAMEVRRFLYGSRDLTKMVP